MLSPQPKRSMSASTPPREMTAQVRGLGRFGDGDPAEACAVVVMAPHLERAQLLTALRQGDDAIVVDVPRTPVDVVALLRAAGRSRSVADLGDLGDSTLLLCAAGSTIRAVDDDALRDLMAASKSLTVVVSTEPEAKRVAELIGCEVTHFEGDSVAVRVVNAVDLDDALDMFGDEELIELVADWQAQGAPDGPQAALAAHAAGRLGPSGVNLARRQALGRSSPARRAILLGYLGDPEAASAARAVLCSGDMTIGERRFDDRTWAERQELCLVAMSDLADDDVARREYSSTAGWAALEMGRYDEAQGVSADHTVVLELQRRFESPEFEATIRKDDNSGDLLDAMSWLPGIAGYPAVPIERLVAAVRSLAARQPDSVDTFVAAWLVEMFSEHVEVSGDAASSSSPIAAVAGSQRGRCLFRLAEGMVGFHRSRPPAEVVDLVEFAVEPSAATGLAPLAAAHFVVALADSGRSAEAVAATETFERNVAAVARDVGARPLPALLALWARVEAELAAGRPARAVAAARSADAATLRLADATPFAWLVQVSIDWAEVETNQSPSANPLFDLGDAPVVVRGASLERSAIAAWRQGDLDAAVAGFESAAASWRGWHDRGALRSIWAAGDLLSRSDRRDDARTLLIEAETEALRLEALTMLSRVRQSLRRIGVRSRTAGSQSVGPLSGREVEVMGLVGQGRSSADIAILLGIAKSTVETQVSSAMTKLGAATRLQAASMLRDMLEDR